LTQARARKSASSKEGEKKQFVVKKKEEGQLFASSGRSKETVEQNFSSTTREREWKSLENRKRYSRPKGEEKNGK